MSRIFENMARPPALQCAPANNNPRGNAEYNIERPQNTHQDQNANSFKDPQETGNPNTDVEPEKEKHGFMDDFNTLMTDQIDIKKPSPFPFISLKEIEKVYGNSYFKLRQSYFLPAKDSDNLPSIMFNLLLTESWSQLFPVKPTGVTDLTS